MPQGREEAVGFPTSLVILVRVHVPGKVLGRNRHGYNLFPLHKDGKENEHTNNVYGHYFINVYAIQCHPLCRCINKHKGKITSI